LAYSDPSAHLLRLPRCGSAPSAPRRPASSSPAHQPNAGWT